VNSCQAPPSSVPSSRCNRSRRGPARLARRTVVGALKFGMAGGSGRHRGCSSGTNPCIGSRQNTRGDLRRDLRRRHGGPGGLPAPAVGGSIRRDMLGGAGAALTHGSRAGPRGTASIGPLLGPPQRRFHSIQGGAPERVPKYRSEIMNRFWLPSGRSSATLNEDQGGRL
jgi:hypothetical protein